MKKQETIKRAEDLRKHFEDTGYSAWINADLYPNGRIYTQEYTEWLEKKVLSQIEGESTGLDAGENDISQPDNLQPCPLCGGNDIIYTGLPGVPKHYVKCYPCGLKIEQDRRDKVIGMWNNLSGREFFASQVLSQERKKWEAERGHYDFWIRELLKALDSGDNRPVEAAVRELQELTEKHSK